jgi:uncharacterized protein YjbI with pentapeptide repeats
MTSKLPDPDPDQNGSAGKSSVWPIDFSVIKSPPQWFAIAVTTIVILFAFFLFILALVAVARLAIDLLSDNQPRASEAVKSLLPIAAAAIGLPLIVWRLVILNQQTRISEAKTQIDRETHYTSIFSKSVEQLGQTRELIETRETDDRVSTTTKTVPNIEIRLGGIHSLARLAEESSRDVTKIENMLLSYVRENSWSSRQGETAKLPRLSGSSSFDWAYDFRKDKVDDSAKNSLDKWLEENGAETEEQKTWAKNLPDTRVDVNESIDAAIAIKTGLPATAPSLFFESLFVGRLFKAVLLQVCNFERCTFVRCRFQADSVNDLNFLNSRLINCTILSNRSNLEFRNCVLIDTRISEPIETKINAYSTTITNVRMIDMKETAIGFTFCDLVEGTVSSKDDLTLSAAFSTFWKTSFWNQSFTPASRFKACSFVEADFSGADLSKIQNVDNSSLEHATASPSTISPKIIDRPSSWPEFDPSYKDDEIPF